MINIQPSIIARHRKESRHVYKRSLKEKEKRMKEMSEKSESFVEMI